MPVTSKTGLLPSVKKDMKIEVQPTTTLDVSGLAVPAPFVLRPFAGVYNPFPYGCSILCNHPADYEAKDVVKRAKDTWATEGRALLASEEFAARSRQSNSYSNGAHGEVGEDAVPEELFRKYTDTDSRPLTPAPTVASVITKTSQARRCVTPDPMPSLQIRERTLLVLDLRRSHSQETISWQCGMPGESAMPMTMLHPTARTPSRATSSLSQNTVLNKKKKPQKRKGTPNTTTPTSSLKLDSPRDEEKEKDASQKLQQQVISNVKVLTVPTASNADAGKGPDPSAGSSSGETEIVKRRGKKRRGKKTGRDTTKEGEREFQGIPDPGETQVSALGNESRAGSTRPSLTPGVGGDVGPDGQPQNLLEGYKSHQRFSNVSFLDADILKQLQRQLDQEVVDSEFDIKRKIALEEALRYRTTTKQPHHGDEMKMLKKELQLPINNPENWLSIPRVFTRQSARFELPMDSRTLNSMTPLQYAKNYVFASTERLVLYNHVFNLHREELDEDEETDRVLLGKNIITSLGEIMGRPMTDKEANDFQKLMGWTDDMNIDFRTFVGVGAICERLLGHRFCSKMPSHEEDPRHEVERADFESLDRKLMYLKPDPRISQILKGIRDL